MSIDPRAYYDSFSKSYDDRRGHGYHALIDEVEAALIPVDPSLQVLEAGCGTGLVLDLLRERGLLELFGVDLSAGMLAGAKKRGNRVAQGSVTALPFPDASFDVAYSFKVLAHVVDIRGALAEMVRVVKPGGMVLAEFYNRNSIRGLRWKVKNSLGGESTGEGQRETELFTRYDSLAEMASYLPAGTTLEAVRGAVIFTPAAVAFRIPGLAAVLASLERTCTASRLARYAGFVTLVIRRT